MKYLAKRLTPPKPSKADNINAWKDITIPVLSLMVALATIGSNLLISKATASRDFEIKKYEVTYKLKCDYYSEFQKQMSVSTQNLLRNRELFSAHIDQIEGAFYKLEPLLPKKDRRTIKVKFMKYTNSLRYLDFEIRDNTTGSIKEEYIKDQKKLEGSLLSIVDDETPLVELVYAALFSDQ